VFNVLLRHRIRQKIEHVETCDQVFTSAEEHISLTAERYLEWTSFVDHSRAKIIIHKATDHFPNDASLWNKRLSLLIEESAKIETIKQDFSLACQNSDVKNSSLIWNTVIDYAQEHDNEWTDKLFELSQSDTFDLSLTMQLKSKYLNWIHQTKSLNHVRKLFDRLSSRIPASLPFYLNYIQIEQSIGKTSKIDTTRIKTAFEQAIIYFGKSSADLWISYLDYLKQYQSLDFVAISRIHSRALHALDSDELTRFNSICATKNLT